MIKVDSRVEEDNLHCDGWERSAIKRAGKLIQPSSMAYRIPDDCCDQKDGQVRTLSVQIAPTANATSAVAPTPFVVAINVVVAIELVAAIVRGKCKEQKSVHKKCHHQNSDHNWKCRGGRYYPEEFREDICVTCVDSETETNGCSCK